MAGEFRENRKEGRQTDRERDRPDLHGDF